MYSEYFLSDVKTNAMFCVYTCLSSIEKPVRQNCAREKDTSLVSKADGQRSTTSIFNEMELFEMVLDPTYC